MKWLRRQGMTRKAASDELSQQLASGKLVETSGALYPGSCRSCECRSNPMARAYGALPDPATGKSSPNPTSGRGGRGKAANKENEMAGRTSKVQAAARGKGKTKSKGRKTTKRKTTKKTTKKGSALKGARRGIRQAAVAAAPKAKKDSVRKALNSAYGKLNPTVDFDWKDLLFLGGGFAIGIGGADILDRYIATRAKKVEGAGGTEVEQPVLYAGLAASAINMKPDTWRYLGSAGGAVVLGGASYFVKRHSEYAAYGLGGAAAGFFAKFLHQVLTWEVMPRLFKVDKWDEQGAANRLYPDRQTGMAPTYTLQQTGPVGTPYPFLGAPAVSDGTVGGAGAWQLARLRGMNLGQLFPSATTCSGCGEQTGNCECSNEVPPGVRPCQPCDQSRHPRFDNPPRIPQPVPQPQQPAVPPPTSTTPQQPPTRQPFTPPPAIRLPNVTRRPPVDINADVDFSDEAQGVVVQPEADKNGQPPLIRGLNFPVETPTSIALGSPATSLMRIQRNRRRGRTR